MEIVALKSPQWSQFQKDIFSETWTDYEALNRDWLS